MIDLHPPFIPPSKVGSEVPSSPVHPPLHPPSHVYPHTPRGYACALGGDAPKDEGSGAERARRQAEHYLPQLSDLVRAYLGTDMLPHTSKEKSQ